MTDARVFADAALGGRPLTRDMAQAVLGWPAADVLALVEAAFQVRRRHFGLTVKLNYLSNIQSGVCPEDCSYCSQSRQSKAPIEKYKLQSGTDVLKAAAQALAVGASRLCLVAAMRGPSQDDVGEVAAAVRQVKTMHPGLEICCCLGLLQEGQAETLKNAGVDAYNHNLNTTERHYKEICSTHTFNDRVQTVERVKAAGLSSCSGVLLGMGETRDDLVDLGLRYQDFKVDSIPVNFLMPIQGTPLAAHQQLTPVECLKALCLFRFFSPASELRVSGGREIHLRSLQPLAFYVANSIFIGDYLTTKGQSAQQDLQMIRDLGFTILGQSEAPAPALSPADLVQLKTRSAARV